MTLNRKYVLLSVMTVKTVRGLISHVRIKHYNFPVTPLRYHPSPSNFCTILKCFLASGDAIFKVKP